MRSNPVVRTMLAHKTIRKYKARMPSDRTIQTIVRAAQQAAFASQSYSLLLSKSRAQHPYRAPLLFTICVDLHKFELIMAKRSWKLATNDLTLLLFGIEDALLMAENLVLAGESLGLGSCFLGFIMYNADRIAVKCNLPPKVFPIVQLVMGYPDEDPLPRPRYPLEFVLFEGRYPELSDEAVTRAMRAMDEGYLRQDYYRKAKAKISLEGSRKETYHYDGYSWTEHISRKWGQWHPDAAELRDQLARRGFDIRDNDAKRGAQRHRSKRPK
jgi:nitroreductase